MILYKKIIQFKARINLNEGFLIIASYRYVRCDIGWANQYPICADTTTKVSAGKKKIIFEL